MTLTSGLNKTTIRRTGIRNQKNKNTEFSSKFKKFIDRKISWYILILGCILLKYQRILLTRLLPEVINK